MIYGKTIHIAPKEKKESMAIDKNYLLFHTVDVDKTFVIVKKIYYCTQKFMMNILDPSPLYCTYYQAHVKRELCWFFTASLRSYEYVSFDRTLDPEASIFEFFVVPNSEKFFLTLMKYFQEKGIIDNLVKLPNRLEDLDQQV